MCECHWTALAEFRLSYKGSPEEIYCLCSRSFGFSKNSYELNGQEELLESDEVKANRENASAKGIEDAIVTNLKDAPARDFNISWQNYWAINGERLIWKSWIDKYSDYINPDFVQNENKDPKSNNETAEGCRPETTESRRECCNLRLELTSLQIKDKPHDAQERNCMLVRNLSHSDSYEKLDHEIDGWNPLSPQSTDCETEIERLLSSQCPSCTNSSARTVDSMTNVTHLTSSIELSNSSKDSFDLSEVSSIRSSLTSISSEDSEDGYEQQWNVLWTKHYEQEHLRHYKEFCTTFGGALNYEILTEEQVKEPTKVFQTDSKQQDKKAKASDNEKGECCCSEHEIKSSTDSDNTLKCDSSANLLSISTDDATVIDESALESNQGEALEMSFNENDDQDKMASMGFPLAFGVKRRKARNFKFPKKSSSDQAASSRIKAAFTLLGIEMQSDAQLTGTFEYKMKNIRSQNRRLQFQNSDEPESKRRHIYFTSSDEGEENRDKVVVPSSDQDVEDAVNSISESDDVSKEQVDYEEEEVTPKTYRKKKRKRKYKIALPDEIKQNPTLKKFWNRRYSLFSKFDLGIKLDEESWFSVTPEPVAKHIAERCQTDILIDAFCGAGGNTIQFALTCKKVIAIDIDPVKIELARHNASIYGVSEQVEFIVGDFFQLESTLKGDVVFLSPPWGGTQYINLQTYDLEQLQPQPFSKLIVSARHVSPNVALFLPKNCNTHPLVKAAELGGRVEIEQNFLGKKLIALMAYYGDLVKDQLEVKTSE